MRDRKLLMKIYNTIDKIATKGLDNKPNYIIYIDDLVNNSNYHSLELVMELYYDIIVSDYVTLDEFKNKSWVKILKSTNSNISKKIKKMFDISKLYQIGLDIYDSDTNSMLGSIQEIDSVPSIEYLIQNEDYSKIVKNKITILEVFRCSDNSKILITDSNNNLNPDSDLLDRYKIAIEFITT